MMEVQVYAPFISLGSFPECGKARVAEQSSISLRQLVCIPQTTTAEAAAEPFTACARVALERFYHRFGCRSPDGRHRGEWYPLVWLTPRRRRSRTDGRCPAEVGIGGRHVVQALVVTLVVVVLDEGLDLGSRSPGRKVVFQQDAVFRV